jgi:hypothetical protein
MVSVYDFRKECCPELYSVQVACVVKIETALLLGNFTCSVTRYCTIGLLFSGLCSGLCWVAGVSVTMLLSPSVWS